MKYSYPITSFSILCFANSCRKDELKVADTVTVDEIRVDGYDAVFHTTVYHAEPSGEYLAAFPDSWWLFLTMEILHSVNWGILSGISKSYTETVNCEFRFDKFSVLYMFPTRLVSIV